MKKALILTFLFLFLVGFWVYSIDPKTIDPGDIDLRKVDLSKVGIYFQGPITFYVNRVGYAGQYYAAILEYDGAGNLTIKEPRSVTTELKPRVIDLSNVKVSLEGTRLYLDNVIVDGYSFSGYLDFVSTTKIVADVGSIRSKKVTPVAPAVAAVDVQKLKSQISDLEKRVREKDNEIASLKDKISSLNNEIASLKSKLTGKPVTREDVKDIQQDIEALERGLIEKWSLVTEKWGNVEELYQRYAPEVAELFAKLDRLSKELAKRPEVTPAPTKVVEKVVEVAKEEVSLADYRNILLSGFRGGTTGSGSWEVSSTAATQRDANQKFAKYILDARQTANELVYSVRGRALSAGWVGYGLHILASGAERATGYGYGQSYLIWLTRDPVHFQTDTTYIQIYRSYNDIRMVQLVSHAIPESIGDNLDIDVYVNRSEGKFIVFVNGKQKFTFQQPTSLASGTRLVLRALGSSGFRNLQVKTR
ncbi:MAG: hypothetical protein DRP87_13620 [Spirochaetes bacterium]|nr:MAG: hypothetical protein DRP87_13620 [Spirochaetota bacterium]